MWTNIEIRRQDEDQSKDLYRQLRMWGVCVRLWGETVLRLGFISVILGCDYL